jgi:multidrug efflux pump subunit AcrB
MPQQNDFEVSVQTQGRLVDPEEFENIIVNSTENGRIVRLRDLGRAELAAESYVTRGYLGDKPAIALPIFQCPGTNNAAAIFPVMEDFSVREALYVTLRKKPI